MSDTAYGMHVPALPDGWTPLEAALVVKALDDHGIERLCSRYSTGLNSWEALGMLTCERDSLSHQLVTSFRSDDDD